MTTSDKWWLGTAEWADWEVYLADWHSRRKNDNIPAAQRNPSWVTNPPYVTVENSGAVFHDNPAYWKTENLDGSYTLVCSGGIVDEEKRRKAAVKALKELSK